MANNTPTYKVDENDPRLTGINTEKNTELTKSDSLYDDQIKGVDTYTDKQINALDSWEKEQIKNQNAQTDFAIDKIEQNRDNARKDYLKEQSGAYVDWQKQSSKHGANAEAMAARGMGATGYSESSQVSMYNTYQNRVATAREAFIRADTEFQNDITAAKLANSSALAQIAFETLQKKLEVSLAGFQYKNTLIQAKAQARRDISQDYWSRYNAMYGNIHQENVLNENVRQYEKNFAEDQRQFNKSLEETNRHNSAVEANAKFNSELEAQKFRWQKEQASKSASSSGGSSSGGKIQKNSKSKKVTGSTSGGGGLKMDKKEAPKSLGKKVGSKAPKVDTKSVLNLGYGPISAKKLNNLVQKGQVKEYEKNGKLKYKKVFQYK